MATTAQQATDIFVHPANYTDEQIRSVAILWLNNMKPHIASFYDQATAYFSGARTMNGAREAIARYGFKPAFTPPAPFVTPSWIPVYRFWKASMYLEKYPMPAENPLNCVQINTEINSINAELENLRKRTLPGGDMDSNGLSNSVFVLNDRITDLQGLYSLLNCDLNIVQQQQAGQLSAVQAAAASNAPGQGTDYTMYVVYGVAGLIVVVALLMLLKKKKT